MLINDGQVYPRDVASAALLPLRRRGRKSISDFPRELARVLDRDLHSAYSQAYNFLVSASRVDRVVATSRLTIALCVAGLSARQAAQ